MSVELIALFPRKVSAFSTSSHYCDKISKSHRSIKRRLHALLDLLSRSLASVNCNTFGAKQYKTMASSSEYNSSLTDAAHIPDYEKGASPHLEKPSPSPSTAVGPARIETEVTYPEGGRDAWLVVLGAWCGLTASLGIYNTAGVFEVVISKVILPEDSPSTIGWIFSSYAFVNWVCGVQVGPTFDAIGPRALIIAGAVCTLVGIFSLSVCTGKISFYPILYASSILVKFC